MEFYFLNWVQLFCGLGKVVLNGTTQGKVCYKMVESKSTCPKWHFGQVGHGGKKTVKGVLLTKFLVKKMRISCSV
jgi:hypothetical protein